MGKNRSKDFRYVFANAFRVRFSDNDVTLTLGITEDHGGEGMLDEVAVIMTPTTLKIFLNNMITVLQKVEADSGEIPVPSGKLMSSFDEMIDAGIATRKVTKRRATKKAAAKKPTNKRQAK